MAPRRPGLVLLILSLGLPLGAQAAPDPAPRLGAFRAAVGLTLPRLDGALTASARGRSEALARQGLLTHVDEGGRGPGLQALAEGLPPGEYGEVLGVGPSWAAVWEAWLASPTHRAVLARAGWTLWGWGRAEVGAQELWVLRFYRP